MNQHTRKTILIGFAFLSISAFWQMYDNVIPKILTETFNLPESISGYIMAADNILALFLLPFFGGLSDRCKSPLGRRRPFILTGTLLAVAFMTLLPLIDNSYFDVPSKTKILLFIGVLALVLVSMGIYRSPAVALMPDVTPKPLRSKGNAIINLMGAIGGIMYLIVTTFLYSAKRTDGLEHINYLPLFIIVAGIMLIALCVIMFVVNEPKLVAEQAEYEKQHPEFTLTQKDETKGKEVLPKKVKISLLFLLSSIALWYIGYNGISTWFTTYAKQVWDMNLGDASLCLTIATVGAIVTYIPAGALAGKIGRKKTILFGAMLLSLSFGAAYVYTLFFNSFSPILYVIFVLVGVAWAAINVNSLPMVVEMCSGADVGKFTGYYYTFSMAGQIVTPILAGYILKHISYDVLFLYSSIFVLCSFITMCFVMHGDNKIEVKKGLEAFDVDD